MLKLSVVKSLLLNVGLFLVLLAEAIFAQNPPNETFTIQLGRVISTNSEKESNIQIRLEVVGAKQLSVDGIHLDSLMIQDALSKPLRWRPSLSWTDESRIGIMQGGILFRAYKWEYADRSSPKTGLKTGKQTVPVGPYGQEA